MALSSADHAKMLPSLCGQATFLAHAFLKEPGPRGAVRVGCHGVRFGRPPKLDAHQPRGPWRGARRSKPWC